MPLEMQELRLDSSLTILEYLLMPLMQAPLSLRSAGCALALVGAMLMSGCASLGAPDDITRASPEWLETQKPRIAERAEARWSALIAGDLDAAYQFSSPEYRSVFSLQQFRAKFGTAVVWTLARVKSVKYDELNVAQVLVQVEYQAPVGLQSVKGVREMTENWLYSTDLEWYISQ